jgi:hypothetical protein
LTGTIILVAILALWLLANSFVTLRLWRYGGYSVGQKMAQTAIVWFLPAIGASIVWDFIRDHAPTTSSQSDVLNDEASIADLSTSAELFGGGIEHHDSGNA